MSGKHVDVTLRLIDKITGPLKNAEDKLTRTANQWTKAGKQIQRTGNSISAVGEKLTKNITVPVAGAGFACLKVASDFEKGMSTVQSICGASGKELQNLSDKAKEMGAKTKFSATEATDAFKYMAMAGWNTQEMMNGIEGVMYLAGATGEDLAQTSDIVTDALTAFGMSAKETNRFVDVLAKTANNSNTNVGMLGESFQYVAPVAGALKYNVEDISTALGLMANSGVKASMSGTSLRSWLSRMADPTDKVEAAMKKLGISLTNSDGSMKDFKTVMQDTRKGFSGLSEAQKSQYASTIAGKQGMSGLLAIVNSSDGDFEKLSNSIYDADGACKKMYDTAQDNLHGQLTILKSTLESIGISLGERMTPYVKNATEWLQKLAEKFNSLSDKQKDMIIKIALAAAAMGPFLLIFGKTTKHIGSAVTNIGKFGKAIRNAGGFMKLLKSPSAIVVASLLAIVVAGVLVYKNWDKIKKAGGKMWSYIKKVFKDMGLSGKDVKEQLEPIGEKFQSIAKHAKKLWKISKPYLKKYGDMVKLVFGTYFGVAIGQAVGIIKAFFKSITGFVKGIMSIFDGLLKFITGVFTGNWSKAWDGVKEIFGGAFEGLKSLCKLPMNAVIGMINGAISGINKLGLKIPDWVPEIGGKNFSINIPKIPMLAVGTKNWRGGFAQISERGGEIVDLPKGSRVYPHDETVRKAYSDGAKSSRGSSIVIAKLADTIVVREEADIDKIATRIVNKLSDTSKNLGGAELGYLY